VIDGRLFVRTSYAQSPVLAPGTEILAINGLAAKEVIRRLLSVISSDGRIASHRLAMLNDGFNHLYATHLGSPSEFELCIREPDSERSQDLLVPALDSSGWNLAVREYGPRPPPGPGKELETRVLAEEDVALLIHSSFRPAVPEAFERSLEAFFSRIDTEGIGNLIVDLRRNPGGDPQQGALLVSYLVPKPFTYFRFDPEKNSLLDAFALRKFTKPRPPAGHHFRGRIFVLIGGRNTSTAGHVISLLKQQGRVVFVGQESGATWTCNNNSKDVLLPASGIRVRIARTTYQAAVAGLPPGVGIRPDHEVTQTVEAMLAGRDLTLELALKLASE
jgi:hypothetical protein